MTSFLKKSRLLGLALAAALAFQPLAGVMTADQAHADYYHSPITATTSGGSSGGMGAGGWILGGIFVSVASLIACGIIVGSEEDREMTLEEAWLSAGVPLGCLFRDHLTE